MIALTASMLLSSCARTRSSGEAAPRTPTGTPATVAAQPRTAAPQSPAPTNAAPPFMLGNFDDDYGGSFSISTSEFVQLPRGRFRIVQWNVPQQYFIAQNDSLNRSDPNKWTRIDWVPLSGMNPYTWAFCFTAYKATTRQEAESAPTVKRDTPKTGCGGFPFTRMKRRD